MKNTSSTKTELRVKSPLVSVIIPVFNVEEYLEECINSILRQTLTDIEIICINDGSTDSSPDILKKYAEQDRRITVYSQDNCGLSAARNLGMRAARGRYTYFIDSDDWLERDALRDLYTRAEKDQLDLLLFDADAFADDPSLNTAVEMQKDYYIRNKCYDKIYKGADILNEMFKNNDFCACVYLMLARTDFYRENNIKFIEKIFHEDEPFTFQAIASAERVAHINKRYYKRRYRQNSIITIKKTFAHAYGCFKSYLFITDFAKTNKNIEYKYITGKALSLLNSSIFVYGQLDPSERETYLKLGYYERILFRTLVVEAFNQRNAAIRERDTAIAEKKTAITEKDIAITEKNRAAAEKDMAVRERDRAVTERDGLRDQMTCLVNSVSFRAGRIITLIPRTVRDILKRLRKSFR